MTIRSCFAILSLGIAVPCFAQSEDPELLRSVLELRQSIGDWDVITEFLADDGSVQRSVEGTYSFSWVVEDRVVSGTSALPSLDRRSGILFYINESARNIEMVAVGPDGRLWIMTGPLGGDTRYSQEYDDTSGGTGQLRFTRYNVSDDGFESRMAYTDDGGNSWKPGNHQVFRRAVSETPAQGSEAG